MSKRLGLVIDQERCIGCEACTVACKIENNSLGHWIQVKTQNVPQKDTPSGQYPDLKLEWLPHLCNHCSNPPCVDACPNEVMEVIGEEKSVKQLVEFVLRDKPFYDNSGGGITISGGEPTMQHEFLIELLKAMKEQEGSHR